MVLYSPEIRTWLDLRLFVELDADTRALRRLVRNLGHQYDPIPEHSAQSIANYYLESAKVGHARYIEPSRIYADLIVRGDADFARTAPMVAAVIRGV
jgi:uridine kinase